MLDRNSRKDNLIVATDGKKNVDKSIGVLGHAEALMCMHSSAQGRCEK